jgi:phospholipase/lecithinase/hemolysin
MVVAVVACLSHPRADGTPYTKLIVFGDSLSDTGNLDQGGLIGELIAAFADVGPTGTFSNGPVWHDYLADGLGLPRAEPSLEGGDNYAFGGAETDLGGAIEGFWANLLLGQQTGIEAQVEIFIDGLSPNGADPDALYILWGGGNDMRGESDPANAADAVGSIETHVRSLVAVGARTFLVPNLPNLGRTPEVLQQGSAAAQLAEAVTLAFNGDLETTMEDLAAELPLDLFFLDVFAAVEGVVADPDAFGFTNVTEACPDPDSACPGYLFWDDIHPTTAGHEELGQLAFALLTAPVAGDLNGDGLVNGLDVEPFVHVLVSGPFDPVADVNGDGQVNGLDVDPFVAMVVGAGAETVPEPSTLLPAVLGLIGLLLPRRRPG